MRSLATARRHDSALVPESDDAPCGLATAFLAFVDDPAFPCVAAKAALSHGTIQVHEFAPLGSRGNDVPLLGRIEAFGRLLGETEGDRRTLHSLVAVFDGPADTDERRFEALVWSQLQRLHDLDAGRGRRWADGVSSDPRDPEFSLSLAGHAYFVIGMHPGASRHARRTSMPALVFNPHRQFETLREEGRYHRMQSATRARDTALQGSINPNLADFGRASEARQYSGREVGPEWRCPLRVRGG